MAASRELRARGLCCTDYRAHLLGLILEHLLPVEASAGLDVAGGVCCLGSFDYDCQEKGGKRHLTALMIRLGAQSLGKFWLWRGLRFGQSSLDPYGAVQSKVVGSHHKAAVMIDFF